MAASQIIRDVGGRGGRIINAEGSDGRLAIKSWGLLDFPVGYVAGEDHELRVEQERYRAVELRILVLLASIVPGNIPPYSNDFWTRRFRHATHIRLVCMEQTGCRRK